MCSSVLQRDTANKVWPAYVMQVDNIRLQAFTQLSAKQVVRARPALISDHMHCAKHHDPQDLTLPEIALISAQTLIQACIKSDAS